MNAPIKIILGVILLGCLLDVPYGYFQFARISTCIGFGWLAHKEYEAGKKVTSLLCVMAAILLNPLFKVHFVRSTWNAIDLCLAIALFIWEGVPLLFKGSSRKK